MRRPPIRFWRFRAPALARAALLFLTTTAPAQEGGAAPLARFIPQKDLIAYVEFDGFETHGAAWRQSAAYKILNETKFGALLEDVARQSRDHQAGSRKGDAKAEEKVSATEVIATVERVFQKGFAVAQLG